MLEKLRKILLDNNHIVDVLGYETVKFETEHTYLYVYDVLYASKIRVNLVLFDRFITDEWK